MTFLPPLTLTCRAQCGAAWTSALLFYAPPLDKGFHERLTAKRNLVGRSRVDGASASELTVGEAIRFDQLFGFLFQLRD